MQKKMEKRTLLVGVLSIIMCCAALVGTAYAWMMDSVSADVAIVQAGTLEVDLVDSEGKSFIVKAGAEQAESTVPLVFTKVPKEGEDVVEAENITVWDVGETYQLPAMYVVNKGTANFSYTISIEGITDIKLDESTTVDLTELIDFSIQINDESGPDRVVISGKLKGDVDLNQYGGMEFTGIAIKIDAEQTGQ